MGVPSSKRLQSISPFPISVLFMRVPYAIQWEESSCFFGFFGEDNPSEVLGRVIPMGVEALYLITCFSIGIPSHRLAVNAD